MLDWTDIYGLINKDSSAMNTVKKDLIESTKYRFDGSSVGSIFPSIMSYLYFDLKIRDELTITSIKYGNIEVIKK